MALKALLSELNATWAAKLGEAPFTWKLRKMKTVWGSCHWAKRHIVYNAELARAPRELVEYVVVHELTHFKAHDHGKRFYALMDERLPNWQELRHKLNKREWQEAQKREDEPLFTMPKGPLVQEEFFFE